MNWDVAKKNTQLKEKLMEGLINDALPRVTEAQWKNYCNHIVKVGKLHGMETTCKTM